MFQFDVNGNNIERSRRFGYWNAILHI